MQAHDGLTGGDVGVIGRQPRRNQCTERGNQRRVVQRLAGFGQSEPRQITGGLRILRLRGGDCIAFGQGLRPLKIPFRLGQLHFGALDGALKRRGIQRCDLRAFLQKLPLLCVEHHHTATDFERQIDRLSRSDLPKEDPLYLRCGPACFYQFDRPDGGLCTRGCKVVSALGNKRRRKGRA